MVRNSLNRGQLCLDEWAKAEALQQVENDKKVLHEYLKNRNVDPKNTDSNPIAFQT